MPLNELQAKPDMKYSILPGGNDGGGVHNNVLTNRVVGNM